MIDKELLDILACPETKKNLVLAEEALIKKVNEAIAQGRILNRKNEKLTESLEGGLLREGDDQSLYPIRDNIPILLVDELISLKPLQ